MSAAAIRYWPAVMAAESLKLVIMLIYQSRSRGVLTLRTILELVRATYSIPAYNDFFEYFQPQKFPNNIAVEGCPATTVSVSGHGPTLSAQRSVLSLPFSVFSTGTELQLLQEHLTNEVIF